MTNQITTLHLDDVINNHAQDMTNKVVAITGTTSGTGFICAREVAKKAATVILLIVRVKDQSKPISCFLNLFPKENSIPSIVTCKVLIVCSTPQKQLSQNTQWSMCW